MLLLRLPSAAPASLARLQRVNSWALGLELLLLIGFVVSLGGLAMPLLQSSTVAPHRGHWSTRPGAAVLRLVRGCQHVGHDAVVSAGADRGFEMRYSI